MKTDKELAIDEVAVMTNGLNFAIKEAYKVGLEVDVVVEAYCGICVTVKDRDDG